MYTGSACGAQVPKLATNYMPEEAAVVDSTGENHLLGFSTVHAFTLLSPQNIFLCLAPNSQ